MPTRFEDGLGYLIHHLMYAFRQKLAQHCADNGYPITSDELALLMIIHQSPEKSGLSQKELASTLAKDKAVITRLTNSLCSKALVVRCVDESDRRVMRVGLTKAGIGAVETLRPGLLTILRHAYAGISEEEFRMARNVLNRILCNVKES